MTISYALYIEPNVPDTVRATLGDVLKSDEHVTGWWNHLPNLYLITSDSKAEEISDMVAKVVKPWAFLVLRVDPTELQGWLPDRAWEWIQRRYA